MANNKKSSNLLPSYLQTDKNVKFLSGTIDQFIQTPELERVNGFIGETNLPNFNPLIDNYISLTEPVQPNYRLIPSVILKNNKDEIQKVITYDDFVNEIQNQGGDNSNLFKALKFRNQSYDPLIDWDKFINYDQYYWLATGPDPIQILENPFNIIGKQDFSISNSITLTNGMKLVFTATVNSGTVTISSGTEYIVEGVGEYIHLIDFNSLEPNGNLATNINEVFDNTLFDSFPFDADKKLAIQPEYVTINKASVDLNPWTRYNRWFHQDVIKITSIVNDTEFVLDASKRALRPIIEFNHNLQLFNFGKVGIKNVDLLDNSTEFPLIDIPGNIGFYIDGVELEEGFRIIFNNNADLYARNKIYKVIFNPATNLISLIEDSDSNVDNLASVSVNYGNNNGGKSYYFKEEIKTWVISQQHTVRNEAPLFEMYDINGVAISESSTANDFVGNKIFGYDLSGNSIDPILGLPANQAIGNLGIGGFLFKNYFYLETFNDIQNRLPVKKFTRNLFYKFFGTNTDTLYTVWTNYRNVPLFVNERFYVNETSTSTFASTAFTANINGFLAPRSFVNGNLNSTTVITTSQGLLKYDLVDQVSKNSSVLVVSNTNITPKSNQYYETPRNLIFNPLNEGFESITFSELGSHFRSMLFVSGVFSLKTENRGIRDFPLRGTNGFARFGSILTQNTDSIVLPMIFLGDKSHNLIDSLRWIADQYAQWKFNFLKLISEYDQQTNPIEIVDSVLEIMNQGKLIESNFYRSDMVPYGNIKTIRTIKITVPSVTSYPIGIDFDLDNLSFKSVLIYKNNLQQIYEVNYRFNAIDNNVEFITSLSTNDIIEIHIYNDTLGNFVPPTATKLGLWPKYVPGIISDDRYASGSKTMIQCHDGSLIKAFGDYRDNVILELEKRIFNNIKVEYGKNPAFGENLTESPSVYKIEDTLEQYNSILEKEFHLWITKYNVDYKENTSYDKNNWKTYNFINSKNNYNSGLVRGNWRSIYKFFYDTDRPHTHPWEMLGFSVEPLWWKDIYGSAPYTSSNTLLWTDLRNGYIRGELTSLFENIRYSRPGLSSFIPVDALGNLKNPETFLIDTGGSFDYNQNWQFGDFGPAEIAWRNSSYFPFAVNIVTALLRPIHYFTRYFDTSRIVRDRLENQFYKDDGLYINPKKLKVDGVDGYQTAGYVNLVLEKGIRDNVNYASILADDLKYLDLNLTYKLGGFTTKEKIQIKIDAVDPQSSSPGLVLPQEDFNLYLHTSNPNKVLNISGIVVQRNNGKWSIKGYDRLNPFFSIYKPIHTGNSPIIKIGGKDSSYTTWQPNYDGNNGLSNIQISDAKKFYKQGQIVFFNGSYYRVTVSHVGQPTFNTSFFAKLAELPTSGGIRVISAKEFETSISKIYYNTEFNSVQEVYDVIIGYGKFLESQGFVFDNFNTELNEVVDWKFSAKEFVFWTTNNWADGNLIALSPFAEYLKIQDNQNIVDNILSNSYEYSLQRSDGLPFPVENFDVSRIDNICVIKTKNTEEGLFFAKLNLIQKQHILILNNTTIFNDTIYDSTNGFKQNRIKLLGFKTKNWNGDLTSPGFFNDRFRIENWEPFKKYYVTQVVQFNSLYYSAKQNILLDATFDFTKWKLLDSKPESQILPNFDYKINQFEDFYSLDIDNFDTGQQTLAQHLIGYSPRPYLSKIITNSISQYKFYQGFIKDKGTKKSIDNIVKTGINRDFSSIDIKEEWAFRVGAYGSESTFNEIEFPLIEGSYLENPYLVILSDSLKKSNSGIIHYTTASDILIKSANFVITGSFVTNDGTFDSNDIRLITAGYPILEDVTATAYSKNSLLDIANNDNIKDGDTVWLGFLEDGGWDVYRYTSQLAKISGVYVSSPGSQITFVTNINHNLAIGDIVSIVRFNNQVNGVYIVRSIDQNNQFTVDSDLAGIVNEPLLTYGSLYKFESVRFNNFQSLSDKTDLIRYDVASKIWIDKDQDDKWVVLEKINNYSSGTEFITSGSPLNQNFGFSILVENNTLLVSSPTYNVSGSYHYGKVSAYRKLTNDNFQNQFDFILNSNGQVFCKTNTSTEFGYALAFDIEKDLYIVGAPSASDVRASTSSAVLVSLATSTNSSRGFSREGLVKVSTKNNNRTAEVTKFVFTRPYTSTGFNTTATTSTHENSRFGHSIYVNKVKLNTATTLLVGAPGNDSYRGTGTVFAYKLNGTGTSITGFEPDSVAKVVITTAPVSTLSVVVSFSSPDVQGGTTATGVLVKSGNTGSHVLITNRGSGYTIAPTITFTGTNMTTVGAAQSYIGFIELVGTYTVSMLAGSKWGSKIAGSDLGDTVAISAPNWFNFGAEGIVQLFDSNLYWKQTLESPFGYADEFGQSLSVSSSGKFVFVGSIKPLSKFNTYGKVAVFVKDSDGYYNLSQTIVNPIQNSDLKFGQSIAISPDENTLLISSLGTNRSEIVRFFENKIDLKGETTFDNKETRFVSVIEDSGTVYTFNKYDDYFIPATELVPDNVYVGGRYGKSLAITNSSIFIGAPYNVSNSSVTELSRFYQFKTVNSSDSTWSRIRYQEPLVDPDTFNRICLLDTDKEEVLEYLDIFDPLKNKLPGRAEQELKFKSASDPAIYSIGIANTNNDNRNSWIDEHVGELWWDLSTAKYIWYEQGNEVFRKNNWGKLFPGSSIDIYEWVKSDLLPSEWAVLADSPGGLAKGISGQPKYPDNSVISVKQILNTVTGVFDNVYYFWVKNKVVLPDIKSRRITAYEVSRLISDPLSYGLKHVNILSKNSISFSNIQGDLVGKKISANLTYDIIKNRIPRHTEWTLLNEGDSSSMPNDLLTKKLLDSLIGRDSLGNAVPDPSLSFRQKYGIQIRPRQSMFKNRFEAIRNCLEYANFVLSSNRIRAGYDFTKLNLVENLPDETTGSYDILVDDYDQVQEVATETFVRAELSCIVYNGKIIRVDITNPGYGYRFAPTVQISSNVDNLAEILTEIDSQGRVINSIIRNAGKDFIKNPTLTVREHIVAVASDVNSNGRWALYKFEYLLRIWNKFRTQLYNTPLFWHYIDYKSQSYNQYKSFRYTLSDIFELARIDSIQQGDYVKILNSGDGNSIILERTTDGDFSTEYNVVFQQNATIEFDSVLWNPRGNFAFDQLSLDETLYDQLPDIELENILYSLKDDIFVDDLKKHWNLLFFKAVKYALSEQKVLDWAFKTSFITVKNSISYLNTLSSYSLDASQYIEDYIKEIKPYRTQIRSFISAYEYLEKTRINTTDFDLPTFYNTSTNRFETLSKIVTDNTQTQILSQYPWKDWTENYTYSVKEVLVADGGEGYTTAPTVSFLTNGNVTTAAIGQAYIRNGKVYKIQVINEGSGYDQNVRIDLTNASFTRPAKVSVILKNEKTRKNIIGLKFDRYSKTPEVDSLTVTYTTSTNGLSYEYELPYHANPDKSSIVATLDKKLILSADYDIVAFSKDENVFNKDYSKFVFKNYLPRANKNLKIVYKKNNALLNAIDRINNFYQPTAGMPGKYLPILMSGLEYPERQLTGLNYDYSTPIKDNTAVFDNGGGWNDFTSYYARAKIINTATSDTTILYLNSVEGIVPGQVLNFLNTPDKVVRTDTVVVAIDAGTKSIQISSASYVIKFATAVSLSAGAEVTWETTTPFNGALRAGDCINISGISDTGYTGVVSISTITSSRSFTAPAPNVLQFLSTAGTTSSIVRAYSLLRDIYPQNKLIGNYNTFVGPCVFSQYTLVSCSPSMMEGYTATWTINGIDVNFGLGRTFAYTITGTNITSADFVDGLSGTITTNATSLPITFYTTSTNNVDSPAINTETFYVNILTWLTTGSSSTIPVVSNSMKLRDLPTGQATWTITPTDLDGNTITSAREGDIVRFVVQGTNIDFASDGVALGLTATGINITGGDITAGVLTGTNLIVVYSEDEFPVSYDIQFTEDLLTEGTEIFNIGLNVSTITNCTVYSTTVTTTVTSVIIIDTSLTQPSTYQLFAVNNSIESGQTTVVEGSTATFRLKTTYVNVGTVVPFIITGTVSVSDLNTVTYTGTFVMIDGGTVNPGGQYADISFNIASDAATTGFENTEYFYMTLPNKVVNSATIYIQDQLSQSYGGVEVYGYTVNGATAFSNIKILDTGSFRFDSFDPVQSLSKVPAVGTQVWSVNTSLPNYYVRGIIEPTNNWTGDIGVTGPGFANTVTYSDLLTGPAIGNWVTVNTAETTAVFGQLGWYAQASADLINQTDSFGRFNLTIQIAATSGGTIISQGVFDVYVYSDIQPTSGSGGEFLDSSGQGNDFRDLL